jgi:sedoheptulokinase
MHAIGIDIGTTSICGVVIDIATGEVKTSKTVNSDAFIQTENSFEKIQSAEKIISLAKNILDELITDDAAVIGVTGQMHGIIYYDANGMPVSPLYTWQDGRGDLPYKNTTYAGFLGSHTGYGNVTDFYNRENLLVPENAVSYCTIHDLFVMQLCGLSSAVMHISDAASFGLFNLEKGSFLNDFAPKIENGFAVAGEYKNIPVSVAIGDNQASVFSSLSSEEDILLNVGTGSQISLISSKPLSGKDIETRPFFDGKYLIVGAALCGGRAYALLKDFYKRILSYTAAEDEDVYAIMDKMTESATQPLTVDTRFSGTRADETIRGSVNNISVENFTPENLTKGLLVGMVDELYDMYAQTGITKSGLVGSGNGIRKNRHLVKISEEKFGTDMKIPAHTEEAAYGAALYGAVASGIFKTADEARKLIKF